MKIWAIQKGNDHEQQIGIECEGVDYKTAINDLYCIARNLFSGELDIFWKDGEQGKATF